MSVRSASSSEQHITTQSVRPRSFTRRPRAFQRRRRRRGLLPPPERGGTTLLSLADGCEMRWRAGPRPAVLFWMCCRVARAGIDGSGRGRAIIHTVLIEPQPFDHDRPSNHWPIKQRPVTRSILPSHASNRIHSMAHISSIALTHQSTPYKPTQTPQADTSSTDRGRCTQPTSCGARDRSRCVGGG